MPNRRFTLFLLLAVVAALVVLPALAAAAEHEGGGGEGLYEMTPAKTKDFIFRVINFAILAGALIWVWRKYGSGFLAGRRQEIIESMEKAEKARADAEAKFKEYQAKLANLDKEIAEIKDSFNVHGKKEKEMIIAKAREEIEKIKQAVEFSTAQEVEKAKAQLRQETALLAVNLAEEILKKKISAEDQKRLITDYLRQMEEIH